MADSLKIQFDAPRLAKALREYQRVSGMDHAKVLEKKGKQLSIELYKKSVVYVPTHARIIDECLDVLRSGRMLKMSKSWPGDQKQRVALEIAHRRQHRFVTAASWLFRRWRVGARGRRLVGNNYKGSAAIIATERNGPMYVELRNSQDGAIVQNQRHGIIGKAMAQVTGDMLIYIKGKLDKRARQFSRKNPIFPV